jgi:hypothetical protein
MAAAFQDKTRAGRAQLFYYARHEWKNSRATTVLGNTSVTSRRLSSSGSERVHSEVSGKDGRNRRDTSPPSTRWSGEA